jgi:ABC-type polysaccharide/polyol phosphate transport system ATPase subunit
VYQQRVNAIYSGRGDNKINISLNDVSFGFKQQYSYLLYLDNILYKIRKGFVLGIIGSNGAWCRKD